MKRIMAATVLVLGLPLSVLACLWDVDTPSSEAMGLREVVKAITGRFERNPDLYYEMRLDRVASHLAKSPDDLAAYDDAGVACDRLGRGDEAIVWMEKKRERLDASKLPEDELNKPRYRYHANLGTFLTHRWIRNGANRAQIDEVKSARGHIAKAIEINPQAHFNREPYQLLALDWIIAPPTYPSDIYAYLPSLLDAKGKLTSEQAHDAVKGLAGLVMLGNAWESVDVFNALIDALRQDTSGAGNKDGGRTHLAWLARSRAEELIDRGGKSLLPDAPTGDALKGDLIHPQTMDEPGHEKFYRSLRDEADAWHQARTDFMLKRLKDGKHPDTDPHFWEGYTEKPAPALPTTSEGRRGQQTGTRMALAGAALMVAILAALAATVLGVRRFLFARSNRVPDVSAGRG